MTFTDRPVPVMVVPLTVAEKDSLEAPVKLTALPLTEPCIVSVTDVDVPQTSITCEFVDWSVPL